MREHHLAPATIPRWLRITGRLTFGLFGGCVNSFSIVATFAGSLRDLLRAAMTGNDELPYGAMFHAGNVVYHSFALFMLLTMLGDDDVPALIVAAVWTVLTATAAVFYWSWVFR